MLSEENLSNDEISDLCFYITSRPLLINLVVGSLSGPTIYFINMLSILSKLYEKFFVK